MPLQKILLFLLSFVLVSPIFGQASNAVRLRAEILAYTNYSQIIVRTDKKQYAVLNTSPVKLEYLPKSFWHTKKMRDFVATPQTECRSPMWSFRWSSPNLWCDVGEEVPPKNFSGWKRSYSLLTFIRTPYKTELDTVDDFQFLTCFGVDLERSELDFHERVISVTLLDKNNAPMPNFPLNIGFKSDETNSFWQKTDSSGKISIFTYKEFSYRLRPGIPNTENRKRYKTVKIAENENIQSLTIKVGED